MKIRLTAGLTIYVIVVFYFAFSFFNYSFIFEDAFIYFRCTDNIINGHGYSFNQGDRIEACSSITWLYLLALFAKAGFNLLTASKLLGIFFGCLSLILIFRITKTFTYQMPWAILPSFLTACSLPFILWNQMGLETSLYGLLFLCLISISIKKEFFIYWPLIGLLLVLTRPEGLFLLLGLVPVFYFYRERGNTIIYPSLVFALLLLTIFLMRLYYFHDLLPSPFYTKIYSGKSIEGIVYIHSYLKNHYVYILLVPFLYLIWKRWNWEKDRSILLGFITVYLLWVLLGGAENNPFSRHLVPVIPAIYIYGITGIKKLCDAMGVFKTAALTSIIACGFVTLFVPASQTVFNETIPNPVRTNMSDFINNPNAYLNLIVNRWQEPIRYNHINYEGNKQILLGEFIRRNYFEGSTLLYDQMGQAPHQAGIGYLFIDSWGLTDKRIGHYYFHERIKNNEFLKLYEGITVNLIKKLFPNEKYIYDKGDILNYIFEQDPDVILLFYTICYSKEHLPYWIILDARFKKSYNLKYYINGALIFEKNGLSKKTLDIPNGLSVAFENDIFAILGKEHPLYQSMAN